MLNGLMRAGRTVNLVVPDGNSTRYQGSMYACTWNEWTRHASIWVVPQKQRLMSQFLKLETEAFFDAFRSTLWSRSHPDLIKYNFGKAERGNLI